MKRILYFLVFIPVLFSCKEIEPIAPKSFVKPFPPLNQTVSTVTIPIEINLSPYFKEAEKNIPKTFSGEDKHCEGVSSTYYFTRKPIEFTGKGKKINYTAEGEMKLRLEYCLKCQNLFGNLHCVSPIIPASCGYDENMLKYSVNYNTEIQVSKHYTFQTKTELQDFTLLDPCEITVFNYDATKKIEEEITKELQGMEVEIDKQFSKIDIKSYAKDTWDVLQDPVEIPGYGFLVLDPKSAAIGNLNFSKSKGSFYLNLKMAPSFVTEMPIIKKSKLPELDSDFKKEGFNFKMDVLLSYDSLSSFIKGAFRGEEFKFKRKTIKVDDFTIIGSSDGKWILKTKFSGSKKGVFYLLATPVLNESRNKITLTNIDFDLESKSVLLKSAKWIFKSRIIEIISQNASFDLDPILTETKQEINLGLNQEITKGVFMEGKLHEISIENLEYTPTHLILRTQLNGDLKLNLK